MHVNGQIRKGKRIYRKAKVVSWTPKPGDAALLNGRFSYFSNTHGCTQTHTGTHTPVSLQAGQMHRDVGTVRGPGSCSCSADAHCPVSYSQHSTEQSQSTQAGTNTYYMLTRVAAER